MNYEFETTPPSAATCSCCGNLTVSVTGFVSCDGAATAFYYARYSNGHAEQSFDLVVCLGDVAGTVTELAGTRVSFTMKAMRATSSTTGLEPKSLFRNSNISSLFPCAEE